MRHGRPLAPRLSPPWQPLDGYSSLGYLRQFPVDILKIDRSFTSSISERGEIPAIVQRDARPRPPARAGDVRRGLGVQRGQLGDQRCDLGQGFLFSRPLEPVDAELLLVQLTPTASVAPVPGER